MATRHARRTGAVMGLMADQVVGRCEAAHRQDPTGCGGPAVVRVVDKAGWSSHVCVRHGVDLLAALDGGRVYGLPGFGSAAIAVYNQVRARRGGLRADEVAQR